MTRHMDAHWSSAPGAVCPWGSMQNGRAARRGFGGVVDRTVRRSRILKASTPCTTAIGILDIVDGGVTAHRIVLD